ncbi:hypothetical protein [Clostridium botulinum]|uniref:hypothetical protein n=1 Tax=Clostridium botulinum TaxID=1491 RepID=UPI0007739559|nr:hypothetical protein [Clostridium botulinum]NFL38722.1 hypothetical protein [Clostridium botulinum]NFL66812.1 hypothetical protein [Clostridium botulinum]NFN09692.1 hypothetical protein [Clostridium botulinum]NFN24537.1 hypothetical protein [Clostridium botulinum]NFN31814.1 hypothetical protein [Clostridium botulinum]
MSDLIERDGLKFLKIDNVNPRRPYRIRCISAKFSNEEPQDSEISYDDAIDLLIQNIKFHEAMTADKDSDIKYIEGVFIEALRGKKLSECNEIVENYIAGQRIKEQIIANPRGEFDMEQVYITEHFKITVICEFSRMRGITKIKVDERNRL